MRPASDLRTIHLRERVPRSCRLTPADVELLLASREAAISLVPTGRRHVFRLTATRQVGILMLPSCRLVIRPKIPWVNLLALLDPALELPPVTAAGSDRGDPDLLDFLACHLARRMQERTTAGLQRGYREQADHGPYLQGRLDLPEQLRQGPWRKEQLHCRFEEFTADVSCNQAPRWTADRLLGLPFLAGPTRQALQQALTGFAGVSSGPPDWSFLDRGVLPEGYGPLLQLCRLLRGALPGGEAGLCPAPAFLVDLERLFEQYVTRQVVEGLGGQAEWGVRVQSTCLASQTRDGQPDLVMRPDLVVTHADRPCWVLDAKWKRLPAQALLTDDVYQVLAYCAALGVKQGGLVYPGGRDRCWDYPLAGSEFRVVVATLRVSGTREQCQRSSRRLLRRLRKHVLD